MIRTPQEEKMKTFQEFQEESKKCWPGYKKKGTKKMFGKIYNNCVKENWSEKYKKSIDCSNPKGFSQKAHCDGRKKEHLVARRNLNLPF